MPTKLFLTSGGLIYNWCDCVQATDYADVHTGQRPRNVKTLQITTHNAMTTIITSTVGKGRHGLSQASQTRLPA